jgi:hypothetical protein
MSSDHNHTIPSSRTFYRIGATFTVRMRTLSGPSNQKGETDIPPRAAKNWVRCRYGTLAYILDVVFRSQSITPPSLSASTGFFTVKALWKTTSFTMALCYPCHRQSMKLLLSIFLFASCYTPVIDAFRVAPLGSRFTETIRFSSISLDYPHREGPPLPPPHQFHPHQSQSSADQSSLTAVRTVATTLEYLDVLDANQHSDDLLIVKYNAPSCRLCVRSGIHYKKLALSLREQGLPVQCVRFDASVLSGATLRDLGLIRFPFVQIFRRGDCVAAFSTGATHMFTTKVKNAVRKSLARSPDEWNTFLVDEYADYVCSNRQARRTLREALSVSNQQLHPQD